MIEQNNLWGSLAMSADFAGEEDPHRIRRGQPLRRRNDSGGNPRGEFLERRGLWEPAR